MADTTATAGGTPPSMRITCMEVESPTDEPLADRVERVAGLVEDAVAADRPDLVVLPELWTTGFFHFDRYEAEAQPLDGPIARRLSQLAASASIWLFGGSFVEHGDDGRRYNTSVVFDPDGNLVGHYRKIHLFGYESAEARALTAGTEPVVIPTPFGPVGLATCYDLRFPEQFRRMVDAGAETFVIVSAWPEARRDHWELLLRARAVENLAWVAACNAAGTQAGTELAGSSCLVSPWGHVVALSGSEEAPVATLDPSETARIRTEFPSLSDRCPIPQARVVEASA